MASLLMYIMQNNLNSSIISDLMPFGGHLYEPDGG